MPEGIYEELEPESPDYAPDFEVSSLADLEEALGLPAPGMA